MCQIKILLTQIYKHTPTHTYICIYAYQDMYVSGFICLYECTYKLCGSIVRAIFIFDIPISKILSPPYSKIKPENK